MNQVQEKKQRNSQINTWKNTILVKMVKDIFSEPLHPAEGIQDFSLKESKARLKRMSSEERKRFCSVKDETPDFFKGYKGRKDTWSIQRKDKMKQ